MMYAKGVFAFSKRFIEGASNCDIGDVGEAK